MCIRCSFGVNIVEFNWIRCSGVPTCWCIVNINNGIHCSRFIAALLAQNLKLKEKLRINKRFMGSWDSRKESIKYQFTILSGERPDLSFPWFYRLFPQALRNLERLFYSWSNWLRILPLVKKWFLRELLILNWSNFAQSIYLLWGIFVSKKFGENCNSIFFGHI